MRKTVLPFYLYGIPTSICKNLMKKKQFEAMKK